MEKLLRLCAVAVLMLTTVAVEAGLVVPDSIIDGLGIAVHKEGTIKTLSSPGDYDW
ncbi:MAG: hypothetical protein KJ757_04275 [Planctomycetes bacterium]|nr:hypothetical protein [Planctomycetota bacterium]MBU1517766.1 hypothetical protein [Planctomycetota bacterium]MBU2458379.1 hypothetical protein [Planctomycetota bacterium]MBU2596760.1 hypothetical protein [Planctomycetota bacterium]